MEAWIVIVGIPLSVALAVWAWVQIIDGMARRKAAETEAEEEYQFQIQANYERRRRESEAAFLAAQDRHTQQPPVQWVFDSLYKQQDVRIFPPKKADHEQAAKDWANGFADALEATGGKLR